MDYGDDPILSTKYAAVHARAAAALAPRRESALDRLRTRNTWKGLSLTDLRDIGVTPEMAVAAGLTWGALVKKHGAEKLIEFGFRWPSMLAAGFSGCHLRTLSKSQLSRLGVNATRALECRPTVHDIAAIGYQAHELRDAGWTAELLTPVGLDMLTMVGFGIPLETWRDELGFRDFSGFSNYSACASAGWSEADIAIARAGTQPAPVQHRRQVPAGPLVLEL